MTKKARIVWSTPATYGMNSRFFLRLVNTAMEEKNPSRSAQKRSEPRWPAQRPVIL
jgi:hypothetical protein